MVSGYKAQMPFADSFWRKCARLLAGGLVDPSPSTQNALHQTSFAEDRDDQLSEPTPGNIAIKIGLIAMIAVALTGALEDPQIRQMLQSHKSAMKSVMTGELDILALNLGLDEDH